MSYDIGLQYQKNQLKIFWVDYWQIMSWGLFKQMVCKLASNKIHNIHKKPNQINYYIKTKADLLVDLSTKII